MLGLVVGRGFRNANQIEVMVQAHALGLAVR